MSEPVSLPKINRRQIVDLARSWIGTPFHHQGRLPGENGGMDCVGLLVCVGRHFGIRHNDLKGYSRFPQGGQMIRELDANPGLERIYPANHQAATQARFSWGDPECFTPVLEHLQLHDGDVLVFWIKRSLGAQHVAIIDGQFCIHAGQGGNPKRRMVRRERLTDAQRKRVCAAYQFAGVQD